jgi:molecular chaperone DnaJ
MDLYAILGLERDADLSDVRRAYRRLARRCHPGVNPGDRDARARFEQITEAFETLSDPERRRSYDAGALPATPHETASFGFEGFDFSVEVTAEHEASTFGDLFAGVLHRAAERGSTAAPEAGSDLHSALAVTFDEAMAGVDRHVGVTRQVSCRACGGSGAMALEPTPCPACQGRGQVRAARGHMVFAKPCDSCRGTGERREALCRACRGEGVEARAESLRIHVPAGVADGAQVRIPGRGHAGRRGGQPGDLVLTVRVEPHRLFRREGDDLHITVPVAIHEAALGAKLDIPTIDGVVRLRVPPGTQSGQRLRLRERGAPSVRTGGRGDLIVEVALVLPALLDERSKELMREFGRINGEDVRRGLWTDEA